MNKKRTGTFTFNWTEEEENIIREKANILGWDISQFIKTACKYYPAEEIRQFITGGKSEA